MMNNSSSNGPSLPASDIPGVSDNDNSRDSTMSDLIVNADEATLGPSLFRQATGTRAVSTMTATNPAGLYNPTFVFALLTTTSNNAKTMALMHNKINRLENTLSERDIIIEELEDNIFILDTGISEFIKEFCLGGESNATRTRNCGPYCK